MTNKRLLILDDDEILSKVISIVAKNLGFEVLISVNPEAFINDFINWRPTHITVNLVMPKMDGVEILKKLARLSCDSAIIVTSGVGLKVLESAQLNESELRLNVRGLLPKSFDSHFLECLLLDVVEN